MEAASTSETSVNFRQTTRRYNPVATVRTSNHVQFFSMIAKVSLKPSCMSAEYRFRNADLINNVTLSVSVNISARLVITLSLMAVSVFPHVQLAKFVQNFEMFRSVALRCKNLLPILMVRMASSGPGRDVWWM
jgi:hypothetical protein